MLFNNYELRYTKHFPIRFKERVWKKIVKDEFRQLFLSNLGQMYSAKNNWFKVKIGEYLWIVVFKFKNQNNIILITITIDTLETLKKYFKNNLIKIIKNEK